MPLSVMPIVFRAKATSEDPTGWAAADVVADR
jgi:hypothetical protein